jgi:hypothetical protein
MNKTEIEIPLDLKMIHLREGETRVKDYYGDTHHPLQLAFKIGYENGAAAEYRRHLKSLPDQKQETGLREALEELADYRTVLKIIRIDLAECLVRGTPLKDRGTHQLVAETLEKYSDRPKLSFQADKLEEEAANNISPDRTPTNSWGKREAFIAGFEKAYYHPSHPYVCTQEEKDAATDEYMKNLPAQPPAWAEAIHGQEECGRPDFEKYIKSKGFDSAPPNNPGACKWVRASERNPEVEGKYAIKFWGKYGQAKYSDGWWCEDHSGSLAISDVEWLEDIKTDRHE